MAKAPQRPNLLDPKQQMRAARGLLARPALLRLILVALLAEIGYSVLNFSTMPVYLRDDRHFGVTSIGFVFVSYLLCEAIFKGWMGHLADKFGPRNLMAFGPLISVFTSLLSLAVPHTGGKIWEELAFIGLRALDGLGAAMLWPAAYAAVGDVAEGHERQQAMSYLNTCYMLGIALALPIGGIVNDVSGVRWASLLLAAGLFLAVSLTVFIFVPIGPHVTDEETGEISTGLQDLLGCIKSIPSYLLLAVVIFAGIGFPMPIVKLFAQDQFRMSESAFGALVFPAAIAMAALSVPMAKFGEKIGRFRSVHLGIGLCTAGMLTIGSGAIAPVMRTPLVLAVASIPVGIGFLLAVPAWMASVSDLNPKKRGINLGAVMTAQGIGAIIGAPIGSALYGKLGPLGVNLGFGHSFARYSPFLGCGLCVGIGWILSFKLLREPKPAAAEA